MRRALAFALLVMLALGTVAARADEVSQAIQQAGTSYAGDDLKETRQQLQIAVVGVNQQIIDMLMGHMPDPPSGWTADDAEGVDASMMGLGFFAGLSMTRTYYPPGGSSIDLSIVANSPLLAAMRMFVTNPMMAGMAGQTGMKLVEICGYDAVEQVDIESDTCDLNVLAGVSTMISFTGDTASDKDHAYTLANVTDCEGIVGVVE